MKTKDIATQQPITHMTTFAAVGDVHGAMINMVELLRDREQQLGIKIQFVLQVGDFEPNRDANDLNSMAAPIQYRVLGDFPAFATDRRTFPWPVYFIGGNHEPYGYLDQHPCGFTLAPNCHYLGRVFAGNIATFRVCALSGIYSPERFTQPHPPISALGKVSNKLYTYFIESEIDMLIEQEPEPRVDILLLHDWPSTMLPTAKVTFRCNRGGNDYASLIMEHLKPRLVLCGHMHYRHEYSIAWQNGTKTLFIALSHIRTGTHSIAIFNDTASENIYELKV